MSTQLAAQAEANSPEAHVQGRAEEKGQHRAADPMHGDDLNSLNEQRERHRSGSISQ